MKDQLPLALVKEQAEGHVAAEERGENGEGDGFDEPDGADFFLVIALRCGTLVWLGCGAGHGEVLYRL